MSPSHHDQLRQEIAGQRKRLRELAAIELSGQELRAGKGDDVLAQIQATGAAMVPPRSN